MGSRSKTDAGEGPPLRTFLLRKLARREHACGELRAAALRAGYPPEAVEQGLAELQGAGWLSDARYATAFARAKSAGGRWGPLKIQAALLAAGIDAATIRQALAVAAEHPPDDDLERLVRRHGDRFRRETDPARRKKKVVDFLLRKGHAPEAVFRLADQLSRVLDL